MTELELYKYIHDNNIEWHIQDNDGADDVLIFPYTFQLEEFQKLVSSIEEGVPCVLKGNYVAIWMGDICDYYGIILENIFPKQHRYDR